MNEITARHVFGVEAGAEGEQAESRAKALHP